MNIQSLSGAMPQTLANSTYQPQPLKPQSSGAQTSAPELPPEMQVDQANRSEAGSDTLKEAAKQITDFVGSFNDRIEFSLDEDTGQSILRVVDAQTKEVLRQIPSEEVLAISKALDKLQGILIQNKA